MGSSTMASAILSTSLDTPSDSCPTTKATGSLYSQTGHKE